jgi:hypothetical protein
MCDILPVTLAVNMERLIYHKTDICEVLLWRFLQILMNKIQI